MTPRTLKNIGASARARLLARSRETGEDFQLLFPPLQHVCRIAVDDGVLLVQALAATFEGRPASTGDIPHALTAGFYADITRGERWRSYLTKRGCLSAPTDFGVVGELVTVFLTPPWRALSRRDRFEAAWPPGGPWQPEARERSGGDV